MTTATEIMVQQVTPIVEQLFAEVDFSKFVPVPTEVHEEIQWVIFISEKFAETNLDVIVELGSWVDQYISNNDLINKVTAIGTECRADMGEEVFAEYQADKDVVNEYDLGKLFIMENLYGAVIQKVHGFKEIDMHPQTTLVNILKEQVTAEFDDIKAGVSLLVGVASKAIFKVLKEGNIEYFNLPYGEFETKFAELGHSGRGIEHKAIDQSFEAILEAESSGEIIAKLIHRSGVNPLEALIQHERLIGETVTALTMLSIRVTYDYVTKQNGEGEISDELIGEALKHMK